MPVSSDIYNQPQFRAQPMATLADLAEYSAKQKQNDLANQIDQFKLDAAKREQADAEKSAAQKAQEDQAIQAVFQKYTGPEGPDRKAIVNELYRVSPAAAQKVEDAFSKTLKAAADARKVDLDNQNAMATQMAQQLQGVTPATYKPVWSRINAMDPEMGAFLGPEFDPDKVQQAVAAGTSRTEYNNVYKDILNSKKTDTEKALGLLAIAKDPAHVQDALAFAKLHGVEADLAAMGFRADDPDVAQRATDLLLGPKERATLAQQQVVNDRQERQFEQSNAIARGNLAVAQGNLELRKQELNKPAAAGGGAKLSATAVEKIAGVDQSLGMIADIDLALPKMLNNIGPYDGRKAMVKLATGVGVDQPLAEFAAQITGLKNAVIKATTGSAMSEPEAKRIMGQLPDLTQPEKVFKARLETTKRNLELLKRRTIELSGGGEAAPAEATEKPVVKWGKDANGNPVRLP